MKQRMIRFVRGLAHADSGVAMTELAFSMPILMLMALTGAELCNYITTRMRISQVALHLADNAARMGNGSQLSSKTITETDINDLLTGGGMQAGELDLYNRGRVVISSFERNDNGNGNVYKVGWQRCRGSATYTPQFGTQGVTSNNGMGPSGRQVIAMSDNATMFVEVFYQYRPLVGSTLVPQLNFTEIASMAVRDRRDMTRIYNTANATVSSC